MKSKRRQLFLWVAVIVVVSTATAVPLLVDLSRSEFKFDNAAVVAAPRDAFTITRPLQMDDKAGTQIVSGRVSLVSPRKDGPITGEAAVKMLNSGRAVLLAEGAEISLLGAEEPASADESGEGSPILTALRGQSFKALGLRDSKLIVALPGGRSERLSGVSGQIVPARGGGMMVSGTGLWRGLAISFELETSSRNKDGALPIRAEFSTSLLKVASKGSFQAGADPRFTGNLEVATGDAAKLLNALGVSWPLQGTVGELNVAGPVVWKASAITFDRAAVSVDGNSAQGTLVIDMAADQPNVSGTLAFDKLVVATQLLEAGGASSSVGSWQRWLQLPAITRLLQATRSPHLSADIRLSARELVAGGYEVGQTAASISVRNGRLSADVAELMLDKGRATGQVVVDFHRFMPKVALRGKMEGLEVGPLVKAAAGAPVISGKGTVVADLKASGVGLPELLADLNGQLEVSLQDGATVAIALAELKLDAPKNRALLSDEILARALTGRTRMTNAEILLKFSGGVVYSNGTNARFDRDEVRLFGAYDYLRDSYDLTLVSYPLAAAARPDDASTSAGAGSTATQLSEPPPIISGTLVRARRSQLTRDAQVRSVQGTKAQIVRRAAEISTELARDGL